MGLHALLRVIVLMETAGQPNQTVATAVLLLPTAVLYALIRVIVPMETAGQPNQTVATAVLLLPTAVLYALITVIVMVETAGQTNLSAMVTKFLTMDKVLVIAAGHKLRLNSKPHAPYVYDA